MTQTAMDLEVIVEEYLAALQALSDTTTVLKPAPGRWSKKEILGHLIDSAHNNLRRFIVAQYEEAPKIVYYQDFWVTANDYQHTSWNQLIQLWHLLNKQIVIVLKNMETETGDRKCDTGELHSIYWLAIDYIRHLKHHLHQILEREPIPYP